MPTSERVYLHIPGKTDYIEYRYLDSNDNPIEKDLSDKVLILECDKDGNILKQLYGHVTKRSLSAHIKRAAGKLDKKLKAEKEKEKSPWVIFSDIFKKK